MRKIDIAESFTRFGDLYSPQIIAELNGQIVSLVRCEGDKVPWHAHDEEDELFYVLEGTLHVLLREGGTTLTAGQMCVVPRGVEHRALPHGQAKVMMFEPAGIAHTGAVRSEITRATFDRLPDL